MPDRFRIINKHDMATRYPKEFDGEWTPPHHHRYEVGLSPSHSVSPRSGIQMEWVWAPRTWFALELKILNVVPVLHHGNFGQKTMTCILNGVWDNGSLIKCNISLFLGRFPVAMKMTAFQRLLTPRSNCPRFLLQSMT